MKLALSETLKAGTIRCQGCLSSFRLRNLYQKQSDQGLHCLPLSPYIFRDSIYSDHLIESKTFQISETGRKFCLKQFFQFHPSSFFNRQKKSGWETPIYLGT